MSDDETRPIESEAPTPPPTPPQGPSPTSPANGGTAAQPAYATPVPPGYYPAYAQERPRFADQVLGMRAVVAVAVACLLIGGLTGFILGRASAYNRDGFQRGPMMFPYGAIHRQGVP